MFFLELSYFFNDPVDVGNLISGSSAFSKTSMNIWKFMVHVLLKPGLENFEHSLALDFPSGSDGKASVYNVGDLDSIPGSGRYPGERKWQPTSIFLPGEFQGQRSPAGYSPWDCEESDVTVRLTL